MIPYGRQEIQDADILAVAEVLKSNYLTQGATVPNFENFVAEYCGAKHAVAVNSATAALHVAALALGLRPGGRLWTSPNTFVASANCGLYCEAEVDFVDIDFSSGNISVSALARKLEVAAALGALPDILVAVHFAGQPCDMAAILALADQYGFRTIEDASHAIGARYGKERVGCGKYADITVFSFHPVKIITTGEGGMALTNSSTLASSMRILRSHGITRDTADMSGSIEGAWYYEQVQLGYNYRMTDFQAALGISQLKRLDEFVSRRSQLAARYDRLLADLPIGRLTLNPVMTSAWHLYVVHVPSGVRQRVFNAMRAAEIGVNVHYIPVHLQPHYRKHGFKPGDFPEAERHYAAAITLPLFPSLSEADQDLVVAVLRQTLEAEFG
jgi:UDP-4-amino-4,6-dideoxy-N-acetyl-beta-L-altrosamine transaminase